MKTYISELKFRNANQACKKVPERPSYRCVSAPLHYWEKKIKNKKQLIALKRKHLIKLLNKQIEIVGKVYPVPLKKPDWNWDSDIILERLLTFQNKLTSFLLICEGQERSFKTMSLNIWLGMQLPCSILTRIR